VCMRVVEPVVILVYFLCDDVALSVLMSCTKIQRFKTMQPL